MDYQEASKIVLRECAESLEKISSEKTEQFIQLLLSADTVFCIGVGRVKMELEAFAKRMRHFGINIYMVGAVNEPAMKRGDLLIVGSGSGESLFPVAIAQKAKSLGGIIVHIGSNPQSTIAPITDLMIRIPVQTKLYLEDEIKSVQPMSSLFEQSLLLWGDSVACMIQRNRGIDLKSLWQYHANLE
ncbi:6-phospho-3-hexuloisomerase [Selenomonas sp. TAMA-11512]|uniref:6-phospho-3-hexuloisomerase n=1 Tax=Selenomonas sp. TAMA-11512 TaxID=3095337 RepID=UPI00308B66D0|nr:6-phospho-3-hexuloisomerase [Selenomonas sp. TAMA-11512]